MSLADVIRSMFTNTKEAYDALEELGATMPEERNLENLAFAIDSLGTPVVPGSIADLKQQLEAGTAKENFPVGTEVPDTYDGQDNPLIIAQYLDNTNSSTYGGVNGVICIRKYVEPLSQTFGTNVDYTSSNAKNILNTTYLDKCSDELKKVLSEINVPYYNGSTTTSLAGQKWFLMSDREIQSNFSSQAEGFAWDYWKDQTGLSTPSSAANSGRIGHSRDGATQLYWLRSRYSGSEVCRVGSSGAPYNSVPSNAYGIWPACFIAGKQTPSQLNDLKEALNSGTAESDFPIGTELFDTWDGNSNPLIVGNYTTIEKDGQKYKAVGLLRKYVEPVSQVYQSNYSTEYATSTILSYLNNEYLDKCSDAVKALISEVEVPSNISNSNIPLVSGKWHLFSGIEVMSTYNTGEGEAWPYWKDKTGLSTPSDNTNTGRIGEDRNGAKRTWWLRSRGQSGYICVVNIDGFINYQHGPSLSSGVLPFCYILASDPIPAPTLSGLKEALDSGDTSAYPVGTEIEDTYAGNSNPLIVAQYLDSTNNSAYGNAEGVILVRKYVEPTAQEFGSANYEASTIKSFIDSTYFNNCSETVKNLIQTINIPYRTTMYDITTVPAKWFLMSNAEVNGRENSGYPNEGIVWEYWKNQTGTVQSNSSNANRIMYSTANVAQPTFLRTHMDADFSYPVYEIGTNGSISGVNPGASRGVLPACFIAKTPAVEPGSLSDLKAQLKSGTAKDNFPVGTEIPDTYAGNDNPLIVAQYLDGSNNSRYNGANGAILVRKYVEPISEQWNTSVGGYYSGSSIKNYLDTTYLNNCSDTLKNLISNINVECFIAIDNRPYAQGKWFLMSGTELLAGSVSQTEGVAFDIWKQRTGLTSPSDDANNGRVVSDRGDTARGYWLRTERTTFISFIGSNGRLYNDATATGRQGILPACFISNS